MHYLDIVQSVRGEGRSGFGRRIFKAHQRSDTDADTDADADADADDTDTDTNVDTDRHVARVPQAACKDRVLVDGPVLHAPLAAPDDLLLLHKPLIQQVHLHWERISESRRGGEKGRTEGEEGESEEREGA